MTLAEFDLFYQQLPYFYKEHGIPNFTIPQTVEQAYEGFQFRVWTSNIKTHRLECIWSGIWHKNLEFDEAFDMEEALLAINKQINPDLMFVGRAQQLLQVFGPMFIGKNYSYENFTTVLFDVVMNHYLIFNDPNSEKVDSYFLNLLMNVENEQILVMLWQYLMTVKA